jgi:2-hydroxychromene-2-carboxylate isomerase
MPSIDFWLELASTYSYLAAARIEAVAGELGVHVTWRPFLLGPIFAAHGLANSPFILDPGKGRYMWRDVERCAEQHGLAFRRPSVFPRGSTLATRVALVGAGEGWIAPFCRAVLAANFAEDLDISAPTVLDAILARLGLDGPAVRALAESPAWKPKLREETERAAARGIFGAPFFVAQGELFWGNDRLEQALVWARRNA